MPIRHTLWDNVAESGPAIVWARNEAYNSGSYGMLTGLD